MMKFVLFLFVVTAVSISGDSFSGELQAAHIDITQVDITQFPVPTAASELASLKRIYAQLMERRNKLLAQAYAQHDSMRERFIELSESFEDSVSGPIKITVVRVNIESSLVRTKSAFVMRESPFYESKQGEAVSIGTVLLRIADVWDVDGNKWVLLWSGNETGFAVSSYVMSIPVE